MAQKDDILLNITADLDKKALTQKINEATSDLTNKLSDSVSGVLSTFSDGLKKTLSSVSNQKIKIQVEFDSEEGEKRLKERLYGSIPKPKTPFSSSPASDPYKTNIDIFKTKNPFATNKNPFNTDRFATNLDLYRTQGVVVSNLAKVLENAINKGLDKEIKLFSALDGLIQKAINSNINREIQVDPTGLNNYRPALSKLANQTINSPEFLSGETYKPKSTKLLNPASDADLKRIADEEKLRIATEKTNKELAERKQAAANIGRQLSDNIRILKELENLFSSFGKKGEANLEKVRTTLSQLSKIKADKDGFYSKTQINQIETAALKVSKLGTNVENLINKQKSIKDNAGNFKLLGSLEKDLENATEQLRKLGLTESQIESSSKKAAGGIAFLKEQILLMSDAIKKGDIDTAFSAFDKITKSKPLTESRIKTIAENRAGDSDATVEKNARFRADAEARKLAIEGLKTDPTSNHLDVLRNKLIQQRKAVTDLEVPLQFVNKVTRNYDQSLISIEKNFKNVNEEFQLGRINAEEAAKRYKKLTDEIVKLDIGISQIDPKRLKEAFDLEQADPRQLSYRLGILGFTLQTVGGTLSNFARTFFQGMDQLAQAAEPIERVNNALSLQVKQGEITLQQQEKILSRLRDIGDLPGSSVEQANKTFNSLQKVNLSLTRRLQLTEGLAKLSASPGGEPGSAEQVTNALLNLANKGGEVDAENFKTLRVQGGRVFAELNKTLRINSASDLEKFGISRYLREVGEALSNIQSPADTTTDRFNRLKSRLSELGVVLGKIIGPGLDKLNTLAKELGKTIESLGNRFSKLPDGLKDFISIAVVGIPVVVGAFGALLTTLAAVGFGISGLKQIKEIIPILKGVGTEGVGGTLSKVANTAATTGSSTGLGTLGATAVEVGGTTAAASTAVKSVSNIGKAFSNTGSIVSGVVKLSIAPIKIFIDLLVKLFSVLTTGRGVIGPVLESFSKLPTIIKLVTAPGVGLVGILQGLINAFRGLFTAGKGVVSILGSVGSGLVRVLGFTNPVGIAINVILGLFTALYNNFNGARDRLVKVFSDMNIALSKFTEALGLGDGGLLTLLGILGDTFDFIFGSIGEVVLDVLNAIISTITDVVTSLTDMINAFKSGNIGDGLLALGKVVLNVVFGLIKNILINITASIFDLGNAIGGAVNDAIFGKIEGGRTSAAADFADYLRSFNGTDKNSIYAREDQALIKQKREQSQQLLAEQKEDSINFFKEERQRQKEADQKRYDDLQDKLKDLEKASIKAREDLISSIFQRRVEEIQKSINLIKETSAQQVELSKLLINNANTLEESADAYNKSLEKMKENQDAILRGGTNLAFTDALKEFQNVTSANNSEFRVISELASRGEQSFVKLLNSINDVKSSGNLNELEASLDRLSKLDVGSLAFGTVQNAIAKTRAVIEKNNEATLNYFKEQRKLAIELRDLEINRTREIIKQTREFEYQRRDRLASIEAEQRNLQFESSNIGQPLRLGQTPIQRAQEQEAIKRVNDELEKQRRLKQELIELQFQELNIKRDLNLKKQDQLEKENDELRSQNITANREKNKADTNLKIKTDEAKKAEENAKAAKAEADKLNSDNDKQLKEDQLTVFREQTQKRDALLAEIANEQQQKTDNESIITSNNQRLESNIQEIDRLQREEKSLDLVKQTNSTIEAKKQEIKDNEEAFRKAEAQRDEIFKKQTVERTKNILGGISEFFTGLNQYIADGANKIYEGISKIMLRPSGNTQSDIDLLEKSFERLIDTTKDLPESATYIKNYRNILADLKSGAISVTEAFSRFNSVIVDSLSLTEKIQSTKSTDIAKGSILDLLQNSSKAGNIGVYESFSNTDGSQASKNSFNKALTESILNNNINTRSSQYNSIAKQLLDAEINLPEQFIKKANEAILTGEGFNNLFEAMKSILSNSEVSDEVKEKIRNDINKIIGNLETGVASSFEKSITEEFKSIESSLLPQNFVKDLVNSFTNNDGTSKTVEEIIKIINEEAEKYDILNPEISKLLRKSIFDIAAKGDENITNRLAETFNNFVKAENDKRILDRAIIENKIKALSLLVDSKKVEIDKEITQKETDEKLIEQQLLNATGKRRQILLREQNEIKVRLIDLKYQRLDIEESYNIQKAIIQNKGNEEELKRIQEDGKKRRELLQLNRDNEIKDAIANGEITVDSSGRIIGKNGKPISTSNASTSVNTGKGDDSGDKTNETIPDPTITGTNATGRIQSSISILRDSLDGVKNSAREAGESLLELYDRIASGEGIINIFTDLIGGASFKLEDLGQAFINVAEFAIAAFGQALGKAITESLLNGGNFLKNLKSFFGDILIAMGTQLIQMGTIATAIGLLSLIPFFSYLDPEHTGLIFGPIAIAAGVAAVLAGKALGGGQSSAATSNTNATNSANSSAGNTGQVDYDPEKDPKLIYQKALATQVYIDIKRDEGSIVRTFVKTVNRDPRLGNLVGNRSTNFAL